MVRKLQADQELVRSALAAGAAVEAVKSTNIQKFNCGFDEKRGILDGALF